MSEPEDDPREREFLARLAGWLEVPDLSEERLAKSLGFEELTDEKLEAWFERMRRGAGSGVDEDATVTQVHEDQPRLPVRKVKGGKRGGD